MGEATERRHVSGEDPGRRRSPMGALRGRGLSVAVLLVALGAVAYLGWRLRVELMVLFGAGLFGIALYNLSRWLTRRTGLPHGASVTIWFLAGLCLATGFGVFAGRQLSDQYGQLEAQLPAALETLEERLEGTPILGAFSPPLQRLRRGMLEDGRRTPSESESDQQEAEEQQMRLIQVSVRALSLFVIWAMVSFYLAWGGAGYKKAYLHLFPPEYRGRGEELADALCAALPWWLVGQLVSMAAIGVLTTVGLSLLGVPLAMVLGVIAAAFSFVPILGPIASVVPAGLVALQSTPEMLPWVLALYAVVQILETTLITPHMQQRVASVPPVLLITGQVVMGVLAGVVGIMFSTPLALALLVTVQVVYVRGVLGEDIETAAHGVRSPSPD